jgi:hypothetical protein
MKRLKPIESLILTLRGRKILIDADLAAIYGVETRTPEPGCENATPNDFPKTSFLH